MKLGRFALKSASKEERLCTCRIKNESRLYLQHVSAFTSGMEVLGTSQAAKHLECVIFIRLTEIQSTITSFHGPADAIGSLAHRR